MAKMPMLPGMNAAKSAGAPASMPGGKTMKPGKAPPFGKGGQRAGMPNFKSRLTKPGGMKAGGKVGKCMASGGAVMAGAGSGVGRLKRSK